MDQEALQRRLMDVFLGELEEHVRSLNDGLLALEKQAGADERTECVRGLFRAAHSLKGAAGSVGVKPIETACHHLEEILGAVRDGSITLGPEYFDVIYAAADAIADAGSRLRAKQDLTAAPIASIGSRLAAAARAASASVNPAPISPPVREAVAEVQRRSERPLKRADPIGSSVETALVRVPVGKLDDMLARGGELLLARNRLELRVQAVAMLHGFVDEWMGEWAAVDELAFELGPGDGVDETNGSWQSERVRACLPLLVRASENLRRLERDRTGFSATQRRGRWAR